MCVIFYFYFFCPLSVIMFSLSVPRNIVSLKFSSPRVWGKIRCRHSSSSSVPLDRFNENFGDSDRLFDIKLIQNEQLFQFEAIPKNSNSTPPISLFSIAKMQPHWNSSPRATAWHPFVLIVQNTKTKSDQISSHGMVFSRLQNLQRDHQISLNTASETMVLKDGDGKIRVMPSHQKRLTHTLNFNFEVLPCFHSSGLPRPEVVTFCAFEGSQFMDFDQVEKQGIGALTWSSCLHFELAQALNSFCSFSRC